MAQVGRSCKRVLSDEQKLARLPAYVEASRKLLAGEAVTVIDMMQVLDELTVFVGQGQLVACPDCLSGQE